MASYAQEMREAEEERRRKSRTTFSLDLLGRRVVSSTPCTGVESEKGKSGLGDDENMSEEVDDAATLIRAVSTAASEVNGDANGAVAALQTAEERQLRRVIANPSVDRSPLFLTSKVLSQPSMQKHKSAVTHRGTGVSSGVRGGQFPGTKSAGSRTTFDKVDKSSNKSQTTLESRTGIRSGRRRVLDESPFVEVAREEERATLATLAPSSQAAEPFDIFQPRSELTSSNQHIPSPFALVRPPPSRSISTGHGKKHEILMPGLVVVRDYLSLETQRQIVSTVRDLGIGQGGFYTPSYRDGAELNLSMMCMGMHWEPRLGTYQTARTEHDGATPPRLPTELLCLANQSLVDIGKIVEDEKSKPLPPAQFDICLANFYRPGSGRLGLHQDKSESHDSLRRGVPVVSLSIGDAADFHYSKASPEWETSSKVRLESGDLLVFGGASRMVFHGVSKVHAGTGPSADLKMLPGRLNLTFRES